MKIADLPIRHGRIAHRHNIYAPTGKNIGVKNLFEFLRLIRSLSTNRKFLNSPIVMVTTRLDHAGNFKLCPRKNFCHSRFVN